MIERAEVYRRRRVIAGAAVLAVAALVSGALAGAGGDDPAPAAAPGPRASRPAAAPPQLPRGRRTVLPRYRVVASYGAPQDAQLGDLGIGTPAQAARRLAEQAAAYRRPGRPVLPALELIAVIANHDPGADGLYSTRQSDATIERYLLAARRAKALLILDIQPGRSDFFTEAQRLERWLREPDVGLALDPEWHVAAGEVPGTVIGRVDSREVNATTAWLDALTRGANLPQKLVVVHQFTDTMVDDATLKPRRGLEIVLNADGFGSQELKVAKYRAFTRESPGFAPGLKLFYHEDTSLMTPAQVLRLHPPPDFVVYE
ncbi:MAG: hypothetical protein QOE28_237 [Solirubrobacteraceae bacterium]|nr:hypothetical protein [Solirubrobacteraceae bacterium]